MNHSLARSDAFRIFAIAEARVKIVEGEEYLAGWTRTRGKKGEARFFCYSATEGPRRGSTTTPPYGIYHMSQTLVIDASTPFSSGRRNESTMGIE
jgi:hypothetical protein